MNQHIRIRTPRPPTQAAEGLPRFRWTLEEFEKLSELGFFGGIDGPRERVELVDGEIVPMPASKGARHERVRGRLADFISRTLQPSLILYGEPGWRPGAAYYLEPDLIVCDRRFDPDTVPPSDVLLLTEISDTTIRYDEKTKAAIYAALGVREYWIVDAQKLATIVHTEPSADGYRKRVRVAKEKVLKATLVPGLGVSIGSLGIA